VSYNVWPTVVEMPIFTIDEGSIIDQMTEKYGASSCGATFDPSKSKVTGACFNPTNTFDQKTTQVSTNGVTFGIQWLEKFTTEEAQAAWKA